MTKHSEMFSKIRFWYGLGYWTESQVHRAVWATLITAEEYTEITGNEYIEQ